MTCQSQTGTIELWGNLLFSSCDNGSVECPTDTILPYCHAWFENYFIECNIELLDAFDNETLPVFQGFGSLMDQCYLQSFGRLCEWSGASKALNLYLLLRNTTCLRPVRSRNRGTRASERVDLEVCFSGPFEGGWAGSILKCSIIRNFLKINIYLSNHAWQYGISDFEAKRTSTNLDDHTNNHYGITL